MNIYVLAFSDDDTGRNDYKILISNQKDYVCKKINNEIVIFVSPNIKLPLIDLIRNCKNEFEYNGTVNVYILASNYRLNNIFNNYQKNIIRVGTHAQFVSNFVNPALGENIQEIQNATTNRMPIIFDPLIIIFTEEVTNPTGQVYGRPEWHKAINSKNAIFYDDNLNKLTSQNNADKKEIRIAEFKVDNNYTVLFVKENGCEGHKNNEGKKNKTVNGINDLLSRILEKWGKGIGKEYIYIAVHALSDYAEGKDVDDFKEQFKDKVNYICDFHHVDTSPNKEFCDLLIKFLEEVENGSQKIEGTCEKIIGKIKELTIRVIQKFSLLKHRLMHLLGPIDTDLQALWDDAERTGRNGFDPEKWKEVCEAYKDYKEDEIPQLALKMIKESIDEIKESLTGTKKESAERLMAIENEKLFIDLKELLSSIKKGDMNEVYEMLKKENGLNPIHKFLIELDKELDSLI